MRHSITVAALFTSALLWTSPSTAQPILRDASFKAADPLIVFQGDDIVWTIHIENTGSAPATTVSVFDRFDAACFETSTGVLEPGSDPACMYDPIFGELTGAWAAIAPGTAVECIVRMQAFGNGTCCNGATVFHAESPIELSLGPACVEVLLAGPDIGITKTTNAAEITPGAMIDYQVEVTNTGNQPLTMIQVDEYLPFRADLMASCPLTVMPSPMPAGFNVDNSMCAIATVIITWDDLPVGGSVVLDVIGITYRVDDLGNGSRDCNMAGVSSAEIPMHMAPLAESCLDIRAPDLYPSRKDVSPGMLEVGEDITWTVTVESDPSGYDATGVTLTDTLDSACVDIAGGRLSLLSDPACMYDTGTGDLTASWPVLSPGASVVCEVIVPALAEGRCCNTATIDFVEAGFPIDTGRSCVDVTAPALPVFLNSTKTITPATPMTGDPMTFTLVVTNQGADANNVQVVDAIVAPCWDVTGFCPTPGDCSSQVTVTPGPAGIPTWGPGPRTLTVPFATFTSGVTQTIVVNGIRAGGVIAACCNQGEVTSDELTPVVHLTDDPSTVTVGDATCVPITDVPVVPVLLRNAEWPGVAPVDIFKRDDPACLPQDPSVTLDPGGGDCIPDVYGSPGDLEDDSHVSDFVSGEVDPEIAILTDATRPLVFYQVDRTPGIGNRLRLVRDGSAIRIHFN